MTRWAMIADLERCVGCQTCTAACKHANATSPAVQWRKVLDVEAGTFPEVSRTFIPVGCQHCDEPPCLDVCPSTATRKRPDGIVTIDYDLCIGCAYCGVACPYQARFKVEAPTSAYTRTRMSHEVVREQPERIGVAQKCTFCVERIDAGLANGLTPGKDPAATPACVNACIATALHFGDIDDPDSNVSRLLREQQSFRMHEELGTGPGFYYVYADVAKAKPDDAAPLEQTPPGRIRSKGVEPELQRYWDWRAAGNFICGGMGSGLVAFAAAAQLVAPASPFFTFAGLALVALGLFLVWLEIGRPLRFFNVLFHPQRSWMTREAYAAAALFPLAAAGAWFGNAWLTTLGGVAALVFLYCQSRILKAARAIPAWRAPQIVALIVTTGLAEGGSLFLVGAILAGARTDVVDAAGIAMLAAVVARAAAWWRYLGALGRAAPTQTLEALRGFNAPLLLVGGLIPLAAVGAGLMLDARFVIAGGALAAVAAGALMKFFLIVRASHNQGFALTHTPVRGTGAPGPAIRPGWSLAAGAVAPAALDGGPRP